MLILFIAVFFRNREMKMIARYQAQIQSSDDSSKT
jgi:hypothetical protein